jgi:hypothetical protein
MAELTFATLLESIMTGLLDTVDATAERAAKTGLHVSDVRLEIPALVRVEAAEPPAERVRVALPELRRPPKQGTVGRVVVQISKAEGRESQ